MAITIVNQSVAALSYTVFGGSTSGSGTGGSGGGSGVVASGLIPSGGTASGVAPSGSGSYTVVFGWKTFPSYTVSASGVIKVSTSAQP